MFTSLEAKRLFREFLASTPPSKISKIVTSFKPSSEEDMTEFKKHVLGRFFEELAFFYLQRKYSDRIILSPLETALLYQITHPLNKALNNYDLTFTVEGITVPDGLIIRQARKTLLIEKVLETKLGEQNSRGRKQQDHYRQPDNLTHNLLISNEEGSVRLGDLLVAIRRDVPTLPVSLHPKMKVWYVVPQDSNLELPRIERIPITRRDISIVIKSQYGF